MLHYLQIFGTFSLRDDYIAVAPYPWGISSKAPSGCQKLQGVLTPYVLHLFLYIHAYDKIKFINEAK